MLLGLGCAEVSVMHSWKATVAVPAQFNKILVVGVFKNSERNLRNQMESHLKNDLVDLGYNAVGSMDEYGPKAFEEMNEDEVIKKINNSGVDAVVTIVLLDRKREKYYVPGRVYYSPYYNMHYRRFYGYYGVMYDRIYSPGYYQTTTRYFWESNFYDMRTKELLYSIQTESFDPSDADKLAHQYGKVIINDMERNGIIRKHASLVSSINE